MRPIQYLFYLYTEVNLPSLLIIPTFTKKRIAFSLEDNTLRMYLSLLLRIIFLLLTLFIVLHKDNIYYILKKTIPTILQIGYNGKIKFRTSCPNLLYILNIQHPVQSKFYIYFCSPLVFCLESNAVYTFVPKKG